MIIRDAADSDVPALAALCGQLGYPVEPGALRRRFAEASAEPRFRALVAEEAGRVLGFIALFKTPNIAREKDGLRITHFCVDEAERSRGVGASLEARACEVALEMGCERLDVTSNLRRIDAHRFYERQGYFVNAKSFRKVLD